MRKHNNRADVVVVVMLELFAVTTMTMSVCFSFCSGCVESEREALLKLKHDLIDPSGRLASWNKREDCCKWVGVVCGNLSGHVIELNLQNQVRSGQLGGMINPSLVDLKHLIHLDLSHNNFQGIHIPKYLGSLENLRYLNLFGAGFEGIIPHQLGNLSNLQYLHLGDSVPYLLGLQSDSITWLSGLSLLKHLQLNYVNLSKVSDSLMVINSFSSLKELKLYYCELNRFPLIKNLSSLDTLDLSENNFQGQIPIHANAIGNLTSLKHLDLYGNQFNSTAPGWLSNLNHLEFLSLGENRLQCDISSLGIQNLTSLQTLILYSNDELGGKLPTSFGRLRKLTLLDISFTKLSQDISQVLDILSRSGCVACELESLDLTRCQIFGHLTNQLGRFERVKSLDLSYNLIEGSIPLSLGKLAHLKSLDLSNNQIEGSIPLSLRNLTQLKYLDLSDNKLNGTVSEIHFLNLTKLVNFVVSNNSLIFKINPNWVPPFQLESLELRSCQLGPQFPLWLQSQSQLTNLDISNTSISDEMPGWFRDSLFRYNYLNIARNQIYGRIFDTPLMPHVRTSSEPFSWIDVSSNSLSGSIFHFICHGQKNISDNILVLLLSDNLFSGDIPDCWMNWPGLGILNLRNNNFTGSLPPSVGTLSSLVSLSLRNNRLSGKIPTSLQDCSSLIALDLSENELVGSISTWIGENFTELVILSLRSNKLHGIFPIQLCSLHSLQILDVACNSLSGTIPRCISNFTAMATTYPHQPNSITYGISEYEYAELMEDAPVMRKGFLVDKSNLNLERSIDISKNNFSGELPLEVTHLIGLKSLNLSHNRFSGKIPKNIGDMRSNLEILDFSMNQLSGPIPPSMASLTFLNSLNMSNNNLIGRIPMSTQLQTFDPSCFSDNNLCGEPLPDCDEKKAFTPQVQNEDEDEYGVDWLLYASMALGFVLGFWCFIGPLLINRRWRYRYNRFLDDLADKFGCFVRKCY